jgi:hypothetical protein
MALLLDAPLSPFALVRLAEERMVTVRNPGFQRVQLATTPPATVRETVNDDGDVHVPDTATDAGKGG